MSGREAVTGDKIFFDLFLSTDGQTQVSSSPISLGGNNGAMFEVWLKSAASLGSNGVQLLMEGSNDGQNWTPYVFGGTTTVATTTGKVAPNYRAVLPTTSAVIPYAQLRMTAALASPLVASQAALIDASLRTFRKA